MKNEKETWRGEPRFQSEKLPEGLARSRGKSWRETQKTVRDGRSAKGSYPEAKMKLIATSNQWGGKTEGKNRDKTGMFAGEGATR